MERKDFLNEVYGYEYIKDELFLIRSWYLDKKIDEDKFDLLPKGILFYGGPGNGKTLLLREFSQSFGFKVFVFKGEEEELDKSLTKLYEEARKEKKAIIVIDELDRLVDKDQKFERVLQAELDGYTKNINILTLASANQIRRLPESLLRAGRFDRKFLIEVRGFNNLKSVIDGFLNQRNFKLKEEDVDELTNIFKTSSISEIKLIFNNVYFRYGTNANLKNFIDEYFLNENGYIELNKNINIPKDVSVHEAGHALYIYKYTKTMKFGGVICNGMEGNTFNSFVEDYDNLNTRTEKVEVALSGLVAEEVIYKKHDIGSSNDLEKASDLAFRLTNRTLVDGFGYFCPEVAYINKADASEYENKIFAIRANRYLKKKYRLVKRRLKKEKKLLFKIAERIETNKSLTREELIALVKHN